MVKAFGWPYIEGLRANGARMGKGSGQVVDDTASGDLLASLAVDYITLDKKMCIRDSFATSPWRRSAWRSRGWGLPLPCALCVV